MSEQPACVNQVKHGNTHSGHQPTKMVATSSEKNIDAKEHTDDKGNGVIQAKEVAPAIEKGKTFRDDFDSLPATDLIKLKFKKNFEGHGIFTGWIEVSVYTCNDLWGESRTNHPTICPCFSLSEPKGERPCCVPCTKTVTQKT